MSELHVSTSVEIPSETVPDLIKRYLASLETNMQGEASLKLSVPIAVIVVERELLLKAEHFREADGREIMDISWHGESGPYPPFKGTLSVCREDEQSSRLDLAGSYHPKLGIAGMAFDAVVGHNVAREAARELLATMKTALENLYARNRKTYAPVSS